MAAQNRGAAGRLIWLVALFPDRIDSPSLCSGLHKAQAASAKITQYLPAAGSEEADRAAYREGVRGVVALFEAINKVPKS